MRYRTALLFLTLAAFGLRAYCLGRQSFWLDEVDAIAMAGEPLAAQARKLAAIGENGPLYFVLFKGWIALAGTTEVGARFLSCLASTVAVPLVGGVTRRLTGDRRVALAAAALAAGSPYYVWYAQDAKMYPLYAALALAAQLALLAAFDLTPCPSPTGEGSLVGEAVGRKPGQVRGRLRAATIWTAYVVASSLALYVHLFAALQIAANTAAGVVLARRGRRGWMGLGVATAVLVLPYVPLAAWQAPVLLRGADVGYRPVALRDMVVSLGEQLTWHLNPAPDRRLLLVLLAALAVGAWRLAGNRSAGVVVLGCWLFVPLVLLYVVQFTVPVFRDRYLIPLLAPLLVLLAGAVTLGPWMWRLPLVVFVVGSWGYGLAHRPPNPDFRAAAQLVREQLRPGERVGFLAEYAERPFAFYYRRGGGRYEKAALPYTNYPGMSEQEGLTAVARGLRGGEGLWVVRFEDWLWDGRDLTTQFLQNRGATRTLTRELNGVSVTRWQVP